MLNGSVTGDTYRKNPARDQGQEPGTGRWKSLHLLTGARRSSKSKTSRPNERATRSNLNRCSGRRRWYNLAILARKIFNIMIKWQLQDAKNRFSELVRKAREEGPQVITLHGRDAVVVVSANEYGKLSRPRGSLVDFLRKSPLVGAELDLSRSRDTGRQIEL